MTIRAGVSHNLFRLGGRDIARLDAADGSAFRMHLEHDLRRPLAVHGKEFLQDVYDEIHGRKVIIEQQHGIQRRRGKPGVPYFEKNIGFGLFVAHWRIV